MILPVRNHGGSHIEIPPLRQELDTRMKATSSAKSKPAAGKFLAAAIALAIGCGASLAQSTPDPLKSGFENPPSGARPRVWWHWMNGNITQEGIKLDLDWMHRVGIAGFQNFDAALATPQVVEHRLAYMTPDWKAAFKYATTLADQLDMEEAIAGSPGWSETGGPWVPASQGMKKYVWGETPVEGGKPVPSRVSQFTTRSPHPTAAKEHRSSTPTSRSSLIRSPPATSRSNL
jgi:hypothetical protein